LAGSQEGHPACNNTIPPIPRGSLPEHMEEELDDPGSPGKMAVKW